MPRARTRKAQIGPPVGRAKRTEMAHRVQLAHRAQQGEWLNLVGRGPASIWARGAAVPPGDSRGLSACRLSRGLPAAATRCPNGTQIVQRLTSFRGAALEVPYMMSDKRNVDKV